MTPEWKSPDGSSARLTVQEFRREEVALLLGAMVRWPLGALASVISWQGLDFWEMQWRTGWW